MASHYEILLATQNIAVYIQSITYGHKHAVEPGLGAFLWLLGGQLRQLLFALDHDLMCRRMF